MRIGDGGLLQVHADGMTALLIVPLDLGCNAGAVRGSHGTFFFLCISGRFFAVLMDTLSSVAMGSLCTWLSTQGFAGRELGIHPHRRDPHALLPARLTELVEFRAVEELSEDASKLLIHDARTVVFHGYAEHVVSLVRHLDLDLGKNAASSHASSALSTASLTVVRRLSPANQSEKVSVLQEELGHRDIALMRRHFMGGVGQDAHASSPPLPPSDIHSSFGIP